MAINLLATNSMPSSVLIADTGLLYAPLSQANSYQPIASRQIQLAPSALPPTLTQVIQTGQVYPVAVSAALEINSVLGGFLLPRMTLTQRNALIPTNGLQIYNITDASVDIYIGGNWQSFAEGAGSGNVVGPAGAVSGDLAIFGDDTGLLLADSGIKVTNITGVLSATINQISNLGYLQFESNQNGSIYLGSLQALNFIDNVSQNTISTIFTAGGTFSSGSSVSALLELDTTEGVFLPSRISLSGLNALPALVEGMFAYASDQHKFYGYYGSPASWQSLTGVTSITVGTYLTASPSNPITGSGTISLATSTANTVLGYNNAGDPINYTAGNNISINGVDGTINANPNTGVATVQGTSNQIVASEAMPNPILSLATTLIAPGTVAINTSSTTAFNVQNGSNTTIFSVDTSTPVINVGANIIPTSNNGAQLGNSSNQYSNGYFSSLNVNKSSGSGNWGQIFINGIYDGNIAAQMLKLTNNGVSTGTGCGLSLLGTYAGFTQLSSECDIVFDGMSLNISFTGATFGSISPTVSTTSKIIPFFDGAFPLGLSTNRWSVVWAVNGTIQTSALDQKTNVNDSTLGLAFINSLKPKSWNWISGPDTKKTHHGFVYEDLIKVADADFGGLHAAENSKHIKDGKEVEVQGTHGLSYTSLIAPLVKAIQELSAEVERLKAKWQ